MSNAFRIVQCRFLKDGPTSHMEKCVRGEVERLTRHAVFSPVIALDSPYECKVGNAQWKGFAGAVAETGRQILVYCKLEEPWD